jgi:hypothetical protein
MRIKFDETYDRWLYDNDFQSWMFLRVLNSAQEITTIERDALYPIDGKIIFNIDTKNWECWSKISNSWYNMEKGSKKDTNIGLLVDKDVIIIA